jgi:hypothetical protein
VLDLAKYDAAVDRHAFIKAETQERAWTPAVSTNGNSLPYGLGWFSQQYKGVRLIWHYGYWPDSFSALYLKIPEKKITLLLLANSDGLSSAAPGLGGGSVISSAFAVTFLRIFVFEDLLSRTLPDPRWSQTHDQFKAEIEQLAKQTGDYRYEAERSTHSSLSRWLDERRAAARKEIKLDPKVIEKYLGQYEIEPGRVITISREGERFFFQSTGDPKAQLFAQSENFALFQAPRSDRKTPIFVWCRDAGIGVLYQRPSASQISHVVIADPDAPYLVPLCRCRKRPIKPPPESGHAASPGFGRSLPS